MKKHIATLLAALLSLAPFAASAQDGNSVPARSVLGQPDFASDTAGTSSTRLRSPQSIAVDPATGKVFVSDSANHRILRYRSTAALATGASAEGVLGQPDFTSSDDGTARNTFRSPEGITVDSKGTLWVADSFNNRVLRFDNAASKGNGADANGVLGQPDFTTPFSGTSQSAMNFPLDVAVGSNGLLWVADNLNNRILAFVEAATKADGANANGVLGQPDFTNNAPGLGRDRMFGPAGVHVDDAFNLWVSDVFNDRVLRFPDTSLGLPSGADAVGVLGQSDFDTNDPIGLPTRSLLEGPVGLATDAAGALWVADPGNNRVLRFDDAANRNNGADADGVLGQPGFDTREANTDRTGMKIPRRLALDDQGILWVADSVNNRVLRFFGAAPPDPVTGTPKADLLVGAKTALRKQKGNNRYNTSAIGQKIRVRTRKRTTAVHYRCQNDGTAAGDFRLKANGSNRKVKVKYFSLAGGTQRNVTGAISSGRHRTRVAPGTEFRLLAKARKTRRTGNRAKRLLALRATDDGTNDQVQAKILFKARFRAR